MIFNILINKDNATIEEVTLYNHSPYEAENYAKTLSDKYKGCDIILRMNANISSKEEKNHVCNWRCSPEDGATTVKSLI